MFGLESREDLSGIRTAKACANTLKTQTFAVALSSVSINAKTSVGGIERGHPLRCKDLEWLAVIGWDAGVRALDAERGGECLNRRSRHEMRPKAE
jgi:hypothetical protein